ncbi:acyl-ACP--UDP-N-acetylglucosamine O-acyltransferase [bacterium]|nr:acyl-ACP--UDP-N-acetylglucosamine O-acyltransferase [bacterium]
MNIHETAIVSPGAILEKGVRAGPYAVIEEGVRIGASSTIAAHAVVKKGVVTGVNCSIGEHSVIGGKPQDTSFKGEESFVYIGDNVCIREFATVHRATGRGKATVIGSGSLIMAYAHVSHNCSLEENVVVVNAVQLAGYVRVGEGAFIGGSSGVHQFVRIGRLAMVGAHSYLTQDLPPFLLGSGHPFRIVGVNRVGLERAGFSEESRMLVKKLFRIAYRSQDTLEQALTPEEKDTFEAREFLGFMSDSTRGVRLKLSDEAEA